MKGERLICIPFYFGWLRASRVNVEREMAFQFLLHHLSSISDVLVFHYQDVFSIAFSYVLILLSLNFSSGLVEKSLNLQ